MGGYEFETTNLRFSYSSMTTPAEVYDYDMATRARILRKRQEIPSGHNPADYVTTRIMATAHDGAQVPVSILHRKDLVRDGKAPLLLYGYGSYGMAMPASFAANRLSLVDRGFVYAIAHIRGGADKGWGWYLDGKREKKTNSFDDFAAAGRALCDAKYTSAKRIVGHGGSAGGMLMGAVANRSGELFAGIVAEVPFVDVLNTMLDDTLPLTPPEWPEWGNPIESEKDFRTILSYSPYDNLAAKDYPAILAMGGLTDPRVTYWEPAKWIARLRATMSRRRPGAAAHQHGRRPRRRVRAVQPARRNRDRLCVRAVGGRARGEERSVNVRPTPHSAAATCAAPSRRSCAIAARVVPPAACTAMPCRIAER